ncbi:PPP4R2-domain-containing protein [Kockiozyma suomiensis]|uniref:PPP4R2-domain-containing protein n=1 Tax=Kockiozyma suomiensis TaxID=1337062 RepID=UPI003343A177
MKSRTCPSTSIIAYELKKLTKLSPAETMLEDAVRRGAFDAKTDDWPLLRTHIVSLIQRAATDSFTPPIATVQKQKLNTLIQTLVEGFPSSPPFTLQRLAELAVSPTQHYNEHARDKYLRALERVVTVESSIQDLDSLRKRDTENTIMFVSAGVSMSDNPVIKLSPIEWLVDTGTPPPQELELEHEQESM